MLFEQLEASSDFIASRAAFHPALNVSTSVFAQRREELRLLSTGPWREIPETTLPLEGTVLRRPGGQSTQNLREVVSMPHDANPNTLPSILRCYNVEWTVRHAGHLQASCRLLTQYPCSGRSGRRHERNNFLSPAFVPCKHREITRKEED